MIRGGEGEGGGGAYKRSSNMDVSAMKVRTCWMGAVVACLATVASTAAGGSGTAPKQWRTWAGGEGTRVLTVASGNQDVVEVTASGSGITAEEARRDALRKALEQGAGVEISSRSQVENFQLIRDTIYSRADGVITDFKILRQSEGAGGMFHCRIMAQVSRSAVATQWGEVQNVLDQIGRPGIAVRILERIDGVIQDSSILESKIEHRLLEAGFDVYARDQLEAITQKESADAAAEENITKMLALAKDFGTQIFITGTAQANSAGVRELAGQLTAMYNCDAAIKMYDTDTAQLCASESLPNTRGGARGHYSISPQAGKRALEIAGIDLVDRCYRSVMRNWATRITAGGLIVLEIEGMRIADALRLKAKLRAINPDKIVRVDGPKASKGIVTFRIKAKMTAEDLAVYLVGDEWAAILEIVDLKTNRIQAKAIGE